MSKKIGITGGIASGKSTVTAYLRQKGFQVLDADRLVHDLQAKGGRLYQLLLAEFGTDILTEAGDLDRRRLGQQVFADPDLRDRLSSLQDDVIRQELVARQAQLAQSESLFFMDIPLLFELGYEGLCDEIWLVCVQPDQQLERLMARNAYSRKEAEQRIAAQLPLEEKKAKSTHVIDNSKSLAATYAQLDQLVARLKEQEMC